MNLIFLERSHSPLDSTLKRQNHHLISRAIKEYKFKSKEYYDATTKIFEGIFR